MEIVFYRPEYRRAFIDLNTAWLREYFCVEAEDEKIFSSVDQMVREGAGVFVALQAGRPVAVCMTMPLGGDEWEICKLAADKPVAGRARGKAFCGLAWRMPPRTARKNLPFSPTAPSPPPWGSMPRSAFGKRPSRTGSTRASTYSSNVKSDVFR